jgi:hypothetical protein
VERWHDDGEDRRWLELGVRAEEGERGLRRKGKRCGEGRVWCSPFYRGWGMSGRQLPGVTAGVMAITPLMARGGLRRGLKRGNQGGGVKILIWHLDVEAGRRGVARCGKGRRWRDRA